MRASAFLLLALLAACAGPKAPQPEPEPHGLSAKLFPLPSDMPPPSHPRDVKQLMAATDALNPTLGSYPPHYASEAHRDATYEEWSSLVRDARARDWRGDREQDRLAILAELYRLGHNLDVQGSAALADTYIADCLTKFPRSVSCHFSRAFLYLSTEPTEARLNAAETSLLTLRELLGPAPDKDVESHFVLLRVFQRDPPGAVRAIDNYLAKFPTGARAEDFRRIRPALQAGRVDMQEIDDP